jgi:hypothetical protein
MSFAPYDADPAVADFWALVVAITYLLGERRKSGETHD